MTAKAKNACREPSRTNLKPQVEATALPKNEPVSFSHMQSSSELFTLDQAVSININHAPHENLLDVIAEAPIKKTKTSIQETP
jgi:hypothetical protein